MVPLPTSKYAILYADPAWDYRGQRQHAGPGSKDTGGAITHYPTVKVSEMKTWDIPSICEKDCLLFMWSSSPHFDQAIDLGKAWGFQWATVAFVWYKQRTNPGFYTMSECELCVVMKRGRIPRPRGSRNQRQFLSDLRGEHSAKPDEIRDRITRMFPTQKKLEMFARSTSPGWDSWGLDVLAEEE